MLMYPIILLNLLVSTFFLIVSSIYKIILSANRQFYFFLSNLDTLFFSCLIALARTTSTMLNRNSECGHPCLVLDLSRKALNLSLLSVMLTEDLSYMAIIMLSFIPSILNLLGVFILKGC